MDGESLLDWRQILKKLFWSVAQYWQVEMTTRLK
jgi:hypothetical protein